MFSFGVDPLSRVFDVKSPAQIYIKTSLRPSEFGFKTTVSVFIDSGNHLKDLIYISKSESADQRRDLYLMVEESDVFQKVLGLRFTLDRIFFDYVRMDIRYGRLQSKQDAELKQLN